MIFYNIITFFDFYLFFALGAYGYYHFRVKYQGENEKIIAERKKYKRVANLFGAYLITTRVFKLMFYSVLFGHSLDPLTHSGKFAEGHHSAAWYECKAMSMPFMERFCFKAVEPNSTLDGACFAPPGHYGHYPDSCQMHLKNAYEDLDTQKEKDDFIKKQIERAKERGEMKFESISFYLINAGINSEYLYNSLVRSCVDKYRLNSCEYLVSYLTRNLKKYSFDREIYSLASVELQDRARKHSNFHAKEFDKDIWLSNIFHNTRELSEYDVTVIVYELKMRLEKIKPGLSSEINMDYSKYLTNVDWACASKKFIAKRHCYSVLKRVFKNFRSKDIKTNYIKKQIDKYKNRACGDDFRLESIISMASSDNKYVKELLLKKCVTDLCCDFCTSLEAFEAKALGSKTVEHYVNDLLFIYMEDFVEQKGIACSKYFYRHNITQTELKLKAKNISGVDIVKRLKSRANAISPNLLKDIPFNFSRYFNSKTEHGERVPCKYRLGCISIPDIGEGK